MSKGKSEVCRRCTGCGKVRPKGELLRVVRSASGETALDPTGKMNGRGAYICRDIECLRLSQRKKGLERTLKAAVSIDTFEALEKELSKC